VKQLNVFLRRGTNLYHTSYILAGLLDLANDPYFNVKWINADPPWQSERLQEHLTICVELGQRASRIVFDIHDQAERFNLADLGACDIYFKRNFSEQASESLESALLRKVHPFGMTFPCRSDGTFQWLTTVLKHVGGHSLSNIGEIKKVLNILRLPESRFFERPPECETHNLVLFQTRLWTHDEVTGLPSAEEINDGRINLVKLLKKELKSKFVGGLMPTEFAQRYFSELVVPSSFSRKAYINLRNKCLIGVYSIGLHHSIAWKLAEYMAGSLCIVSEPLVNTVAHPLKEGIEYNTFSNPDKCLEICNRLLEDKELSSKMRHAAFSYYQTNVKPSSMIRQCLTMV